MVTILCIIENNHRFNIITLFELFAEVNVFLSPRDVRYVNKSINLFTQEGAYDQGSKPGKARTSWVGHALKALRKEINELKVNSIALPRIATGVGGLDWDDVRPLVEEHLGDLDTTIYLYTTFRKGVKADE